MLKICQFGASEYNVKKLERDKLIVISTESLQYFYILENFVSHINILRVVRIGKGQDFDMFLDFLILQ